MKNKKVIAIIVLMAVIILLFFLAEEKDLPAEPDTKQIVAEGDIEIQTVFVSEYFVSDFQPVKAEIQINNNSNYKIQRLMLNVFINNELFKRYYIDEGLNQNSRLQYTINDLTFREDQIGFNQVKFEIVPLQEFTDTEPENNIKSVSIEVFTY